VGHILIHSTHEKKHTHAYESEREEIGHSTWQNLSSLLFTLPSVRSIETNHKSHSVVDIPSPSLHLHFLFFFLKKKKEKKRKEERMFVVMNYIHLTVNCFGLHILFKTSLTSRLRIRLQQQHHGCNCSSNTCQFQQHVPLPL
jgi:hypothetical protein